MVSCTSSIETYSQVQFKPRTGGKPCLPTACQEQPSAVNWDRSTRRRGAGITYYRTDPTCRPPAATRVDLVCIVWRASIGPGLAWCRLYQGKFYNPLNGFLFGPGDNTVIDLKPHRSKVVECQNEPKIQSGMNTSNTRRMVRGIEWISVDLWNLLLVGLHPVCCLPPSAPRPKSTMGTGEPQAMSVPDPPHAMPNWPCCQMKNEEQNER